MGLSDDLGHVSTDLDQDDADFLLAMLEAFDEDLRSALDMMHEDLQNGELSLGTTVAMNQAMDGFSAFSTASREVLQEAVEEQ